MHFYLGMFFIAFATLALELTLARLLSVITWYHLAFFAISTAMLGMTGGAVRVYLAPKDFERDRLAPSLARTCLHFALSVPASLALLCVLPLNLYDSAMTVVAFLAAATACSLPFYFSGVVVSALLTKSPLPVGRLYAADLVGASLGCLFVLAGLDFMDAPSLMILCAAVGLLAALLFAAGTATAARSRALLSLLLAFVALSLLNSSTLRGIRPLVVKGQIRPAYLHLMERWNSFSRVAVWFGTVGPPPYWGPSPHAPQPVIPQYRMDIDGEAGTVMTKFKDPADIDFLRYDVTTIGYRLGRKGPACIIGVGGGRDIQSALLFGHERVTAVELNPIFVDILKGPFREFAGVANRDNVQIVVDEARSYLTHTQDRFALIQMSMIDTWAATGAGAFSLSENALYTVEAWKVFLGRLTDDGVFTVSRWHPGGRISETGRAVSLAVATLLELGVKDPSRHMALITTDRLGTLLLSRRPFSDQDIDALKQVANDLGYRVVHLPGSPPDDPALATILLAQSPAELAKATAGGEFNFAPPRDETPYFFNMLRLRNLGAAFRMQSGVIRGNLTATITLLVLLACLAVLAVVTIVVPLWWRSQPPGVTAPSGTVFWSGAAYFSLIGCGFMLAEMALIQTLSVFLGHPVYALGILLFTLILSTGFGSLLSERLPLTRPPWLGMFPLAAAACIVGLRFLLTFILAWLITEGIALKIAASVVVIFPLGVLLGFFFPIGMRLARQSASGETPWYWALNGIFGVLCSALAVFISIYVSISTNFYLAAGCYALTVLSLPRIAEPARVEPRQVPTEPTRSDDGTRERG